MPSTATLATILSPPPPGLRRQTMPLMFNALMNRHGRTINTPVELAWSSTQQHGVRFSITDRHSTKRPPCCVTLAAVAAAGNRPVLTHQLYRDRVHTKNNDVHALAQKLACSGPRFAPAHLQQGMQLSGWGLPRRHQGTAFKHRLEWVS